MGAVVGAAWAPSLTTRKAHLLVNPPENTNPAGFFYFTRIPGAAPESGASR